MASLLPSFPRSFLFPMLPPPLSLSPSLFAFPSYPFPTSSSTVISLSYFFLSSHRSLLYFLIFFSSVSFLTSRWELSPFIRPSFSHLPIDSVSPLRCRDLLFVLLLPFSLMFYIFLHTHYRLLPFRIAVSVFCSMSSPAYCLLRFAPLFFSIRSFFSPPRKSFHLRFRFQFRYLHFLRSCQFRSQFLVRGPCRHVFAFSSETYFFSSPLFTHPIFQFVKSLFRAYSIGFFFYLVNRFPDEGECLSSKTPISAL